LVLTSNNFLSVGKWISKISFTCTTHKKDNKSLRVTVAGTFWLQLAGQAENVTQLSKAYSQVNEIVHPTHIKINSSPHSPQLHEDEFETLY